ncbi:CPBP family intramembrane metalloprotease [Xanthomonas sp. A2111]|uniref:CPBP family intramembrane metalloprotease n=1 Tax=Xanthomonas hawaiiensis TaxID=3003247 RepID=A0ABU2I779_9XANT|nr:CPBP family intramembrane glutamic endopeptidase [Xanthomonas sp. A2111]MBO9829797.1 CPBP family intramembrane metalloprotease [Xanthomonas sp. A2111]MDS9993488.1 CPBP family intramembrane metalloprotease [Xanthomonas sp. A2111]
MSPDPHDVPALTVAGGARLLVLGEARILQPGMLRWLRALAWAIALLALMIVVATAVPLLCGRFLASGAGPLASFATAVTAAVLYAVAVRLGERRWPAELAWRAAPSQLAVGLLLGAAMFAAVMALMAALHVYAIRWTGPAPVWGALGKALQAGVVEELMLRAILLRLLWRAFGPWLAFALSAALFGLAHLGNPNASVFAALCIAVEAGIMLGAFYVLSGRLWVSIGVHAAWNFTQGYLFGAAVSGTDMGPAIARSTAQAGVPDWLSGGAFGPEASLPGLLVCTVVGAIATWVAWRKGRFGAPAGSAPAA